MRTLLHLAAGATFAALALPAAPLTAQTIVGEVFDETLHRPLAGGFVHLLDADGDWIRGMLTDSAGRFILPAPGAGRYRVRAERIGYSTALSPILTVAANATVHQRLTVTYRPIALEAITVEGDRRCEVRPAVGAATARLWEEARKALALTAWTEDQSLYWYEMIRFERTLDPHRLEVREEAIVPRAGYGTKPFVSAPAEELSRYGYVRQIGDSITYFGLDAEVLLSDAFLDDHCFRIRPGPEDRPELVGLEFEPTRDRWVPDVAGVLWLDRETAELRYLEYGYTRAAWAGADDHTGGRMEFRELPNGAWIVERWRIRMPVRARFVDASARGPDAIRVTAIHESGGEVLRITDPDAVVQPAPVRAALEGTVYDSVRAAPLADATVFLSGTPYSTTTDSAGRYRLAGLPDGNYGLTYAHARLAATGVYPEPRPVTLVRGRSETVDLATPSPATLIATLCPADRRRDDVGHVAGLVRDAATGRPVPDVGVRLSYRTLRQGRLAVVEPWRGVATDDRGRFRFCDVPADVELTLRVTGRGRTKTSTLMLAPGELAVRVLELREPT